MTCNSSTIPPCFTPAPSALSSVEGAQGSCQGRTCEVLDSASTVVSSSKGFYKICKLVGAFSMFPAIVGGSPEGAPVATNISASMKEVTDTLSPLDAVIMADYFAKGEATAQKEDGSLKNSVFKTGKMFFLFFNKTAEGSIWLSKKGLLGVGNVAKTMGGAGMKLFKDTTTIFASSSSIIDSVVSLSKDRIKGVYKHTANMIDESGKVILTITGRYFSYAQPLWFTLPFALLVTVTAVAGLSKVLMEEGFLPSQ